MRRGGGCYDQERAMDPIFMEAARSPYGEFPNDEHATAKLSGHVTLERRQEAQAERPMGSVHVVVVEPEWRHHHVAAVPGERALELVLVRILVSAVCLRAVELPPALVAREQLWRLGLDRRRQ